MFKRRVLFFMERGYFFCGYPKKFLYLCSFSTDNIQTFFKKDFFDLFYECDIEIVKFKKHASGLGRLLQYNFECGWHVMELSSPNREMGRVGVKSEL